MIALIQSWQTDCAVCCSLARSLARWQIINAHTSGTPACVHVRIDLVGEDSPHIIWQHFGSGGDRTSFNSFAISPLPFADRRSVVYGKWANEQVTHQISMRRHLTRTTHLFVAFGKQQQNWTALRNVIRAAPTRMRVIKWIEIQGAWMRYNEPMMMTASVPHSVLYNLHLL